MAITYDPAKREWTLRERGLDFEDADQIFAGQVFERQDMRRDYGEVRMITIGFLRARMVVLVSTPRGKDRYIISMREANEREKAFHAQEFKDRK